MSGITEVVMTFRFAKKTLRAMRTTCLLFVCAFSSVQADTSDKILTLPDSQILELGKEMAETIARSTPSQIDSGTVLSGAIFVRGTKTLIYKYESTLLLDSASMQQKIAHYHCSDPIRKALMMREMTFQHVYKTPSGQQIISATINDCT